MHERAREVEAELRRQRREVDRPVRQARLRRSRDGEDGHRPDRVPRVRKAEERPLEVHRTADAVDEPGQEDRSRNAERHRAERQDEQHRDEHELRRDGETAADLEVEAEGSPVGGDQSDDDERGRRAVVRKQQRQRNGDGEKARAAKGGGEPFAPEQRCPAACALRRDRGMLVRGRSRVKLGPLDRRIRHDPKIVLPHVVLKGERGANHSPEGSSGPERGMLGRAIRGR